MKASYLEKENKTVISFTIKLANFEDLPPLVRKRNKITAYEMANLFDTRIADSVVRAVKTEASITGRVEVACMGDIRPDGLHLVCSMVVEGRVVFSETGYVSEALEEVSRFQSKCS